MKVQVNHTKVERIEVDVNPYKVVFEMKAIWLRSLKLPSDAYIKDSTWYEDVEYHSSHSWSSTKTLREATVEELEKLKAFSIIQKEAECQRKREIP